MFKITNTWLDKNRTKRGGWTKKQAEILFVSWPLQKGWKSKVINHGITKIDRVNFESAAHITCKNKKESSVINLVRLEKEVFRLRLIISKANDVIENLKPYSVNQRKLVNEYFNGQ